MQNKIHFAVHGHTAAEIIAKRADSKKPLMGLTGFKGNYITAHDITVAKNYLAEDELKQLNLIVSEFKVPGTFLEITEGVMKSHQLFLIGPAQRPFR